MEVASNYSTCFGLCGGHHQVVHGSVRVADYNVQSKFCVYESGNWNQTPRSIGPPMLLGVWFQFPDSYTQNFDCTLYSATLTLPCTTWWWPPQRPKHV